MTDDTRDDDEIQDPVPDEAPPPPADIPQRPAPKNDPVPE
jgi:hypothetical protein